MRVRVRYDMPDENGETRRERNISFGVENSPEFDLPIVGYPLWEWFWTISSRLRRVLDGVCVPIPPSEFQAWCQASGTIVSSVEYAMLCSMDEAFCAEMNLEMTAYRERENEKASLNKAAYNGRR